jgi:hypothetical protein
MLHTTGKIIHEQHINQHGHAYILTMNGSVDSWWLHAITVCSREGEILLSLKLSFSIGWVVVGGGHFFCRYKCD